MIDINLLRVEKGGNPNVVRESQRKRGGEKAVELVDQVLALDQEWIKGDFDIYLARFNANEINKEINQIGKKIAPLAKQKLLNSPEALALKKEKDVLTARKNELNLLCEEKEKLLISKLRLIGNIVEDDVVVSFDEKDNKVIDKWWPEGRTEADELSRRQRLIKEGKGVPGLFSHHEVLEKIGGYDPIRGVNLLITRCKCCWSSWLFPYWAWC